MIMSMALNLNTLSPWSIHLKFSWETPTQSPLCGVVQQISALVICSGIGKIFGDSFKEVLSISSAFAVVAALCAAFIPVHHQQENDVPLSEEARMPKTFDVVEDELVDTDKDSGTKEEVL